MSKRVKQFRYYENKEKSEKNYPYGLTHKNLSDGTAFENCSSIIQLGIQALPGTRFYVNGGYDPIIIGTTGIFEIDLNGLSEITSLYFSSFSLDNIEKNNTHLLIDILYEGGEN